MPGTSRTSLLGDRFVTPSQKSLTLPATPRAVKLAREWVARVLTDIGRPELVDSAELGVSELVTNAMLHSTPPVAVRVRGTHDHPRIEVADRSLVPPRLIGLSDDEEDLLSTFGRGLSLVALHSAAWGSDLDPDGHGKTVWFEPVVEPREDARRRGRPVRHRRGDGAPAVRGGARGDRRDPADRDAGGRLPRPAPALPRAAARAAAAGADRPGPLPVRRRAVRGGDAGGAGAPAEPGRRPARTGRGRQRGERRPGLRDPGDGPGRRWAVSPT